MGLFNALVSGCGVKPESQSGGDAYRYQATEMVFDEWVDGDVAYAQGDRTDWKKFEVEGSGKIFLTLNVDLPDSGIELSVYSRVGEPLGVVEKKEGAATAAKLVVATSKSGIFFLRVRATGGAPTSYSLKASMSESSSGDSDIPDF